LRGQLLIAGPSLFDPNFRKAIVLIADHSEEGAFGVILNRPSEVTVADAAPGLSPLVFPDATLFLGGPVQPDAAVVLAEFEHPDLVPKQVLGSIGLLTEDAEMFATEGVRRARVFAGCAGWGPGQLEEEMEEESWIVEPARPDDIFAEDPEELWKDVVRRKGRDYAFLALMPADPSLN
jgi:putative transcriptional regulator